MATKKQIAANKLNSKKSTGPKSERGKAASRKNAMQHGLLARTLKVDVKAFGWDENEFQTFVQNLFEELQPDGPLELLRFDELVSALVRLPVVIQEQAREARSFALMRIANALGIGTESLDESDFAFLSRIRDGDVTQIEYLVRAVDRENQQNDESEREFAFLDFPSFLRRILTVAQEVKEYTEFKLLSNAKSDPLDMDVLRSPLRLEDWKHSREEQLRDRRFDQARIVLEHAKELASGNTEMRGSSPIQLPTLDLLLRYERHLMKLYQDALRFFEGRHRADE